MQLLSVQLNDFYMGLHKCKAAQRNLWGPRRLPPAPCGFLFPSPQSSPILTSITIDLFCLFWGFFKWSPTGWYLLCLTLWLSVMCLWDSPTFLWVTLVLFRFCCCRIYWANIRLLIFFFILLLIWVVPVFLFFFFFGGYSHPFFWVNTQEWNC